jgi:hypothetical protein
MQSGQMASKQAPSPLMKSVSTGWIALAASWATLFFPRDAWSAPLDTVQTRLSPQGGRGLSVEGGQAARLGLDLTLTPMPISSLYEAGTFFGTSRKDISSYFRKAPGPTSS